MRALPRLLLAAVVCGGLPAAAADDADPVLWPERERAFFQDGPGFLLSGEERRELLAMPPGERAAFIERFLAQDPDPETPESELSAGIERRQRLVRGEFLFPGDHRARLLFLHGRPEGRELVECGQTFVPLEIWVYGEGGPPHPLVLYEPRPNESYRLWLPMDTKRPLYNSEMEYWLEQWEELRGVIRVKRFDLQTCPQTRAVDQATGVAGLRGYLRGRPTNDQIQAALEPPVDLRAWARRAAATPLPESPPELPVENLTAFFPERVRLRIVARLLVTLPADAPLELVRETEEPEVRLNIDGVVEQDGAIFETFKVRFKLPPPTAELPIALAIDRALRPDRAFLVRMRLRDETGGAETYLSTAFQVPREPIPVAGLPVPEGVVVALGEEVALRPIAGHDSLLLVPPETEVVLGLWRAEALVTGSRIQKVAFLVDGQLQMSRNQPPFSAELRLAQTPTEQVVRAEGYDAEGELVAADEVVLNQPRGALRVRILEPERGVPVSGKVPVTAEVVVPEERRVVRVDFAVNDETVDSRTEPPWQIEIEVPEGEEVTYVTVSAELDDGSHAEDVRFLNAPRYLERVEVNLVELFTTVSDRNGRLIRDLQREEFEVFEDGRPQEISKFELVENLPLTVGITIDASGSMVSSLPEAQRAAIGFLQNVITPRDRAFAVSFSNRPVLLIPPTDDVSAVEEALANLKSLGWTTLHDAVVTSLYYFRGVRGRRALILLSDGDDTASSIPFREALEYARRSGVAIFTVGLNVGGAQLGIRRKLTQLSEETGGRVFFIRAASELEGVYDEIEEELRSQYLLAYNSDSSGGEEFRTVEVKVRDGKLNARTIRGYYP